MTEEIVPFRIDVPEADLADLRDRLRRTRWPDPETAGGWSQGTPLAYVQDLCRYWASGYDWRAREARLNRFPQFRATVNGLDLHFLHVRSPHPGALPLIMTSGWPGSVSEFSHVIGPLTDPPAHGAPRPTPSRWCAHRCPATASAPSRPRLGGASSGSPPPGPR